VHHAATWANIGQIPFDKLTIQISPKDDAFAFGFRPIMASQTVRSPYTCITRWFGGHRAMKVICV
jgi:hypothetical protein